MSASQPDGYLAKPTNANGKSVLVLHAWWGLNETIKSICNRLATVGYVAFAPDMYGGQVTDQVPEAQKLANAASERDDQIRNTIIDAIDFVQAHDMTNDDQIAVIGFSFGAYFALDLSIKEADRIDKVVLFYGTGPANFSHSQAKYIGHFGEDDPYEPGEYVQGLEDAIKEAGRPVTFYRYPDTGHWFFEPDRGDVYNKAAADLAWERTLKFLKE